MNQDLQGAIVRQSLVAGGLCMALSYINRYFRQREGRKGRILVLTASGSTSFHYMNYMNAFFTAQRLGVPIDTCVLECDSGLLQQGADITGTYLVMECGGAGTRLNPRSLVFQFLRSSNELRYFLFPPQF